MSEQPQRLESVVEEWAAAELRGDTAFPGRALAEDFIGVGPRGFVLNKEQWLDRHEAGSLRYESFARDEAEVRRYEEAAVTVYRQSVRGVYEVENGRYDIEVRFRETLVFVKQEGRWLLAGLQLSPILGRP